MASPISAANAYASIAKLSADPSSAVAGIAGGPGKAETSFTSVLKEALNAVHETGREADAGPAADAREHRHILLAA